MMLFTPATQHTNVCLEFALLFLSEDEIKGGMPPAMKHAPTMICFLSRLAMQNLVGRHLVKDRLAAFFAGRWREARLIGGDQNARNTYMRAEVSGL